MKVLVIDVGGTNVKLLLSGEEIPSKFESGPKLTAEPMVKKTKEIAADWKYESRVDRLSWPGFTQPPAHRSVQPGKGLGWISVPQSVWLFRENHERRRDAGPWELPQRKNALLGLGRGLGTALVVDGNVAPMELGHLPYKKGTYEDYVGKRSLEKRGRKKWQKHVFDVVEKMTKALEPDEVALGGRVCRS